MGKSLNEIAIGESARRRLAPPSDADEAKPRAEARCAAALASTVTEHFPGAGCRLLSQDLRFLGTLRADEELDIEVRVTGRDAVTGNVSVACRGFAPAGMLVFEGTALLAPDAAGTACEPEARPPTDSSAIHPRRYRELLDAVAGLAPLPVAVVHPCTADALEGAVEASRLGLIHPVFVGPEAKLRAVAAAVGIDLSPWPIVNVPHSHAAAERAVTMAYRGEVGALMKGSLHTDELMHEILRAERGLRTGRRASHVFVLDVPSYPKPLAITDGAINIEPDLDAKRDIVQNAIDLMHVIGIAEPKVAILAAVETVSARMRSTIDAAALCKMADRGQIRGGIVDGPLAFDNAISPNAARGKEIVSRVAGNADVLVAPDLEAANMLAKQLQYLADAQSAGLVMGTRVPVILTSRADGAHARIASCALAALLCHARTRPGGATSLQPRP
jgi:phosphate acetyltransferase/phosphate butyryltransferase